jgi:RNA polymerase sigma-70 factor (ECF subfamily)
VLLDDADTAGLAVAGKPAVSLAPSLEREFEERVADSSTLAFRVALGVLRRPEDAEDVAQEAFLRAHRAFGSLRDRGRFRSWLVRVAFRLALDRQRGDRRRRRREETVAAEAAEVERVSESVEDAAARAELRERVGEAVDALPEKLRIVTVLAAIEGHGVAEVEVPTAPGTEESGGEIAMACDRYRDALADLAAGGGAAPEVEAHIERCEVCRGELEVQRKALTLVDTELERLLASEPSPDLPARIRRAVVEDESSRWWPHRARPALATAAALVIGLGAVATWRVASRPSLSDRQPSIRREATGRMTPPPVVSALGPSEGPRAPALEPGEAPPAPGEGPRFPATVPSSSEAEPAVRTTSGAAEFEVLIPPGQEEALLRFAAELQSRAVTPDSLLVAEPSAPLNEPRPLYHVAIEMLTLDSSAVSGL